MAAMIETEHRGYKIRYSENEDVWRAYALDAEGVTLTAVKRKIDAIDRKARSVETIAAFRIGFRDNVEAGTITAKVGRSVTGRNRYWDQKEAVWFVNLQTKSRSRVELKDLIEDTPENRARLDDYVRLCNEVSRIEAQAKSVLEAIPRMAMESMPAEDKETEE